MSPSDSTRLLAARALRLFGFGMVAVVLALHLAALGLDDAAVGLVLTLTLAGDAVLSLVISTVRRQGVAVPVPVKKGPMPDLN